MADSDQAQANPQSAAAAAAAEALDERRRYLRFGEEEASLLVRLRPLFERHAPALIEEFYLHLMSHAPTRNLLGDPNTVERLKRSQREYLLSLASGSYGERYAEHRLHIGRIHEKIGLSPQWYLGAYGLYLDGLVPQIHEHYRSEPKLAVQSELALTKLLILDMQIVLDAYYETRQRHAIERSEQLAEVGELAASIAHEVRNPLAGIKGALEVLRGDLAAKPANVEIVDEVVAQIGRLEGLVRDLLTYARPRPVDAREFDLHELLDRVLRLHHDAVDAAGVTVEHAYGPGTGSAHADPQQLEQVFHNLVQNAVHAMEEGGTLRVTTRLDGGQVVVSFQDSGRGIPESVLPNIFHPFFTTKHRGSGLGLSIVKRILVRHGATIEVESEAERGTTMIVSLPQVRGA